MGNSAEVISKKPRIAAYVEPELKERFEQLCDIRKRTSSNMLLVMIENEIKDAETSGELPRQDNEYPENTPNR